MYALGWVTICGTVMVNVAVRSSTSQTYSLTWTPRHKEVIGIKEVKSSELQSQSDLPHHNIYTNDLGSNLGDRVDLKAAENQKVSDFRPEGANPVHKPAFSTLRPTVKEGRINQNNDEARYWRLNRFFRHYRPHRSDVIAEVRTAVNQKGGVKDEGVRGEVYVFYRESNSNVRNLGRTSGGAKDQVGIEGKEERYVSEPDLLIGENRDNSNDGGKDDGKTKGLRFSGRLIQNPLARNRYLEKNYVKDSWVPERIRKAYLDKNNSGEKNDGQEKEFKVPETIIQSPLDKNHKSSNTYEQHKHKEVLVSEKKIQTTFDKNSKEDEKDAEDKLTAPLAQPSRRKRCIILLLTLSDLFGPRAILVQSATTSVAGLNNNARVQQLRSEEPSAGKAKSTVKKPVPKRKFTLVRYG